MSKIVYEAVNGPVPPGMVVRHTCDNRACINVYHLVLGTHADNVADRVARGRSASGEGNGRSKLTSQQVAAVLLDVKTSAVVMAKRLGVDPSLIRQIRKGSIWKKVATEKVSAIG
jgi:hypothetical protein